MKIILIILAIIIGILGLVFLGLVIAARKRRTRYTTKGFTPLEKRLLSEFYSLFDEGLARKLKVQVAYLETKTKWRQYWDKSMSIECYETENIPLSNEHRFNRKDESKLATIRFTVQEEKYSIEFSSYKGRLWGWKIKPNPKAIQKQQTVTITSKKINTDPNSFAQPFYEKEKITTISTFQGWLQELNEITTIKDVYQPIDDALLANYRKEIDAMLQADYLELLRQTEGIDFEQFKILGISEIRTTTLDDGNYYHIAEFDDGIIAVKENEKSGMLYYCHYSGLIDKLGTDFSKIIMHKIKNEQI